MIDPETAAVLSNILDAIKPSQGINPSPAWFAAVASLQAGTTIPEVPQTQIAEQVEADTNLNNTL